LTLLWRAYGQLALHLSRDPARDPARGLHATISVSRNRRTQHPPTSADDVRTITTAAPAHSHCNIHITDWCSSSSAATV